jgi:hypothetical protein
MDYLNRGREYKVMFSRISKLFEKQRRQLLNARAVSPLGIRQDLEHVRSLN